MFYNIIIRIPLASCQMSNNPKHHNHLLFNEIEDRFTFISSSVKQS